MKTLEECHAAIGKMLNDPQPGLATWWQAVANLLHDLAAAAEAKGRREAFEEAARVAAGWPGVFKDGALVAEAIRALAAKERT